MQVINQVNSTTDYAKFKTLQGNRNVNKVHVKRLENSFNESYLLSPIVINEKFEIIDGQHRFQAARNLNLPINYIVCNNYSLKEVQLLNTNSKTWKKEDYLNAYCDLQYPEYLKFRSFMKKFPEFGILSCEFILTNSAKGASKQGTLSRFLSLPNEKGTFKQNYFQNGELVIPNLQKSIDNAERIMMIKPYYEGFNRSIFVSAMIGVFKIEYYSHAKFMEKLANNPGFLQHCANVRQYKDLIEEIYNYRSREKVSLRY
jgi:hypothetical protein